MEQRTARITASGVSLSCMIGNIVLTLFKAAAAVIAHSGAMLSDAVHSASDIVSDLIVLAGLRFSEREPDEGHPYGHERFECVASILLSVILALVGGGIGLGAVRSIAGGDYSAMAVPGALALAAAIVSIVVKEGMFRFARHYARRFSSTALEAEAWHHRSDALSSVGALIGIAGARLGVPVMEPIASLVICLFILLAAVRIFRDAIDRMVDHACEPAFEAELRGFAEAQPGVLCVDMLHTRMFGSRVYVDLEISADASLTLAEAHAIAERVHTGIEQAYPRVKHIMVHVNPAEK